MPDSDFRGTLSAQVQLQCSSLFTEWIPWKMHLHSAVTKYIRLEFSEYGRLEVSEYIRLEFSKYITLEVSNALH